MSHTTRGRCSAEGCNWIGVQDDLLFAENPFNPDAEVYGCPMCLSVNTVFDVCDEPGCDAFAVVISELSGRRRKTCRVHLSV